MRGKERREGRGFLGEQAPVSMYSRLQPDSQFEQKKKGERRGGVADQKTFSLSTDGESYSGRGDLHRQIN